MCSHGKDYLLAHLPFNMRRTCSGYLLVQIPKRLRNRGAKSKSDSNLGAQLNEALFRLATLQPTQSHVGKNKFYIVRSLGWCIRIIVANLSETMFDIGDNVEE